MKSECKVGFITINLLTSGYQLMIIVFQCTEQRLGSESKRWAVDSPFERRKYPRWFGVFKVTLTRTDQPWEIEAVTYDISQTGSLILTPLWHTFAQDVRTHLRFFLPPSFTGQPGTLILEGPGVVRRLDAERSGMGIEFLRPLRTFDSSRNVQE